MIFRYLYRRRVRRRFAHLLPPENLSDMLATADSMSESRAFRHIFFPNSVIRDFSRGEMQNVQEIIEDALGRDGIAPKPPEA
jgi:hypothetical protein